MRDNPYLEIGSVRHGKLGGATLVSQYKRCHHGSHSSHSQEQKNDGCDKKNVQAAQAPAAALLKRLRVHFCSVLSHHRAAGWVDFQVAVVLSFKYKIEQQRVPSRRCKSHRSSSGCLLLLLLYFNPTDRAPSCHRTARSASCPTVRPGGSLYCSAPDTWFHSTLEKRGSHGFPSRLLTRRTRPLLFAA